jgi:hypothetical protein
MALGALGMGNETIASKLVSVDVVLTLAETSYAAGAGSGTDPLSLVYKATAGKGGVAKGRNRR